MTEDEVRISNATLEIKRNYKQALSNLEGIQKDTNDLLVMKGRLQEEVANFQVELNKIKDDISQQKLKWSTQKHEEMVEIENKRSEAENILKRKVELNEQEATIRKIEASSIEVRNETRRLELEIKSKETALEIEKNELVEDKKKLQQSGLKLIKDKEDFKKKVVEELKKVENL